MNKKDIGVSNLYQKIAKILYDAKTHAVQSVNSHMVAAYWSIGKEIVEEEQQGKERAKYGKFVLQKLSKQLQAEFGRGFSVKSLSNMRQFYLTFPILSAVRRELSWTHYKLIMRIEEETARSWYMNESINEHWSTRQLERQINTLYYERLIASQDKAPVEKEAKERLIINNPQEFIRDPYISVF